VSGLGGVKIIGVEMEIIAVLLKSAAIFMMACAGFRLARTTPSWEEDEFNESTSGYCDPWWGHWDYRYDMAGCLLLGGMLPGWAGVNIFAVSALILAFFGWRQQIFSELSLELFGLSVLLFKPFWVLIGATTAGYIAGRVTASSTKSAEG